MSARARSSCRESAGAARVGPCTSEEASHDRADCDGCGNAQKRHQRNRVTDERGWTVSENRIVKDRKREKERGFSPVHGNKNRNARKRGDEHRRAQSVSQRKRQIVK